MKLMIVDDSNIIRSRIARIMADAKLPSIEIVGFAANGNDALTLFKATNPDMVTMDLTMPEMDGVECTMLLTELDPEDGDTAFGLCDVGIGMPELGTVRISELASIVGPLKLPVARDLYFVAQRTLSDYVRLARINGSIID